MYFRLWALLATLFFFSDVKAQQKLRKLPPNINRPSINLYAPFISGDGQTIVYLSDYTDDGHHAMRWSTRKTITTWNDELEVNRLINRPTLNYRGGYSLTFDGNMLLFTSRKSGFGGFDIWYSNRRGNDWHAPANFGAPLNSRENEGAPMLSPDGNYLYYMRCKQMSEYNGATGCRIMVSKKTYKGWEEPKELPANINTGNSQTPRILADGETMIFASDQFGGKGGLDLFMTTRQGETWSDPIPMDFINTEKDDQFVSVPARGRYLYKSLQGARAHELVQVLIPDEFQSKKMLLINGTVIDSATNEPLNAKLTTFNINERDRLWNENTGSKGEFAIALKEGSAYDLSVDLDGQSYMFFSKIYDLQEGVGKRDRENLKIQLSPLKAGATYETAIAFKAHSSELMDLSTFELRRIGALLRDNQNMTIEIAVYQNNFRTDTVQMDPDLTEVIIDSIYTEIKRPVVRMALEEAADSSLTVPYEDSLSSNKPDSIQHSHHSISDSLVATEGLDTVQLELSGNASDSSATDSTAVETQYEIIRKLNIKYTYHNNRTEDQAKTIKEYLIGRGVEDHRIHLKTSTAQHTDAAEQDEQIENINVKMKILEF